MRVGFLSLTICAVVRTAQIGAQQPVTVNGPRNAEATQLLRTALAGPHDLIVVADSARRLVLPRGTMLPRTTVIVGSTVSVGASVRGDVVVVDGDLFLRPGASIDGRAIALGGGVYGSTLARVAGGTHSIRDETFHATTAAPVVLQYERLDSRDAGFELPILEGLRIPLYDRVDGLSAPWGPILRPSARVELEPTVTYRSHIGEWDPGLHLLARAGETWRLTLDARRGTFTNDAWIYSDLINTFSGISSGHDIRNYYRADRGEVAVGRTDRTTTAEVETSFGVLTERAWSVGSQDTLGARPWTLSGSRDRDNFQRPNPAVDRGRISSAFAATSVRWQFGDVLTNATARVELPWQAPRDARFAQLTADATVMFPTFGVQRFRADIHLVATPGDTAPPQRFAYLGGQGTLPVFKEPLSLGGDQLLLVDMRYDIPFPRLALPFAGPPTFTLRHRIGSAGVQELPRFVQNVGALVTLSFFRVEYSVDPATRKQKVSTALSFAR